MKAPKWFTEFVEKQFKPLAADVTDLKLRMTNVETRLDSLEHNVKIIFDILKRNNLR